MNTNTYNHEELEFLPDFVQDAINASSYVIYAAVEYTDHYTLQSESGQNVEIVHKLEGVPAINDELHNRYNAYKVLYGIDSRCFADLWERYNAAAFCPENRKYCIAMYLELEDFVHTISRTKQRFANYRFSYYYGINRFLRNYRDAVYSCLNIE